MSKENFSIGLLLGAALQSSFSSTMRTAKGGAADLAKSIKNTNKQLSAVQDAKRYRDVMIELRKKQEAAGGGSERLAAGIVEVEKRYREAKREAKSYGFEINKIDDAERKLLKQQKAMEKEKNKRNGGGGLLNKGGHALKEFAVEGAAVAAEIGASAFEFGGRFAKKAQEITETSKALGFNAEAYQELQLAAKGAGVSQESFNTSSINMTRNLSEAAIGQGKAKGALKELGLDAEKLAQMKPEEQMSVLSEALSGVKLQSDKVRIASKIFGKEGGAEMLRILGDGSEKLKEFRQEARATGAVMDDDMRAKAKKLNDSLDAAEMAFGGLTNTVGGALAPALTEVADQMVEFTKTHQPQIQEFGHVVGGAFEIVADVLSRVGDVVEFVGEGIGNVFGFIESKTGAVSAFANEAGKAYDWVMGKKHGAKMIDANGEVIGTVPDQLPESRRSLVPSGALRGGGTTVNNHNTTANIVVHAAPGQSEEKVGEAVRAELDKHARAQARQQRGALHDGALAAG